MRKIPRALDSRAVPAQYWSCSITSGFERLSLKNGRLIAGEAGGGAGYWTGPLKFPQNPGRVWQSFPQS
jgi:hypothetical protein